MRSATQRQTIAEVHRPPLGSGPVQDQRSIKPVLDPVTVAELEQTAKYIVEATARSEHRIDFLGVEPLRHTSVWYPGHRPWVVCPAKHDPLVAAGLPIPRRQRVALAGLVKSGYDFGHLYLAHEIAPQVAPPMAAGKPEPDGAIPISDAEVARLVIRPEAPAAARQTAARLGRMSRTIGNAAAAAAAGAGAIALAPMALLDGLDPAVLGAVVRPCDHGRSRPPAAWFLLAHWNW